MESRSTSASRMQEVTTFTRQFAYVRYGYSMLVYCRAGDTFSFKGAIANIVVLTLAFTLNWLEEEDQNKKFDHNALHNTKPNPNS